MKVRYSTGLRMRWGKPLAHDIVLTEIIEERFDFGMEVEAIA